MELIRTRPTTLAALVAGGWLLTAACGAAADSADTNGTSVSAPTTPPASPPQGPATSAPSLAPVEAGRAMVDDVLRAVNAGDIESAAAPLCSDSAALTEIESAVSRHAAVRTAASTETVGDDFLAVDLAGRVGGHPVTGRISLFQEQPGTWCVYTFTAL